MRPCTPATAPFAYAAWTEIEQAHARIGRFNLKAAQNYFSVDPPDDFPDRLRKLEAPVHVVAGANDCTLGVSQVIALAGLLPAGTITVIDQCGHFPWVEQPGEFRKAADLFLRTVVPSETP
jgi:pimeloyl-ACP methyl ester carboxylesterase